MKYSDPINSHEPRLPLFGSRSDVTDYSDVITGTMASQITSRTIVYSTVYSGAGQRKHQSSASLAFVRGIHRWPVNSPYKGPVTRKMFPFDDVIMQMRSYETSGCCADIESLFILSSGDIA